MPETIPPQGAVNGQSSGPQGLAGVPAPQPARGKTVFIDNYDSFTYNVVQYLSELGADIVVYRNDEVTVAEIEALSPANIVISPGPGHPLHDSGVSIDCIKHFAGKVPILGVCMGLQCMYAAFTGIVEFAGEILHGKTSSVTHDGRGLYAGLPQNGVTGTRYHSLAAQIDTLPKDLVVTSKSDTGVVMGIRHTRYTLEAVQYHPESILSVGGRELFANFLSWQGGTWAENPSARIDEQAIKQAESTKEPVLAMAGAGAVAGAAGAAAAVSTSSSQAANGTTSSAGPSAVGTILERIHVQRLKDIAASKAILGFSQRDLDIALSMHLSPPQIDFPARLTARAAEGLPGVMAEMKRASPSKGDIDPTAHAGAQALSYALGGASVISVLTEPKWFKGSLHDLTLARRAVDSLPNRPAILRKDFIVDVYQIAEARLAGADTVLLIVAMLDDAQLRTLYDYSVGLGMEPLVEVNNPAEMSRAVALGAKVIGVNNRNLHDFNVDMDTTSRLADAAKESGIILCALSGITGRADVTKYLQEGVGAVLVGEALMRAQDKKAFIHDLLGISSSSSTSSAPPASNGEPTGHSVPSASSSPPTPFPLVKICGLQTTDAAVAATLAGADMLGMIFAPNTRRTVTLTQAAEIITVVRSLRGGIDSVRNAATAAYTTSVIQAASGAVLNKFLGADATSAEWFAYYASRMASNPHRPLIAGVFRDQPLSEVIDTATTLKLDIVQLHGRIENVDWARFLPGVLVIRVFHVDQAASAALEAATNTSRLPTSLADVHRPGYHHIASLDTAGTSSSTSGGDGGTGTPFDWSVAQRVATFIGAAPRSTRPNPRPVMLAGGLDASNVAEALTHAGGPECVLAVDTSSGVETDGRKDPVKIKEFIEAARRAATLARGVGAEVGR